MFSRFFRASRNQVEIAERLVSHALQEDVNFTLPCMQARRRNVPGEGTYGRHPSHVPYCVCSEDVSTKYK